MKTKTETQVKHALKKRLLKLCKEYNFESKGMFILYFYNNYVDIDKFDTFQDYQFLLMSDKYSNGIFDEKKTINFLVNERLDIIYRDIIIECGGIDL